MRFIRFDHWQLLLGVEVEVWWNGELQRRGVIDDAAEDSATAWIAGDAHGPRWLLEQARGFELRISPDQYLLRSQLQSHSNDGSRAAKGAHSRI
ncbi:hypothetical protein AB6813_06155 [bacterium RCC_150]